MNLFRLENRPINLPRLIMTAVGIVSIAIPLIFISASTITVLDARSFDIGDKVLVPSQVSGQVVGEVVSVNGDRVQVRVFRFPDYKTEWHKSSQLAAFSR